MIIIINGCQLFPKTIAVKILLVLAQEAHSTVGVGLVGRTF